MLIVDSKAFVMTNECKPIVPSLGPLEANMLLILLLVEKIRSHALGRVTSVKKVVELIARPSSVL